MEIDWEQKSGSLFTADAVAAVLGYMLRQECEIGKKKRDLPLLNKCDGME